MKTYTLTEDQLQGLVHKVCRDLMRALTFADALRFGLSTAKITLFIDGERKDYFLKALNTVDVQMSRYLENPAEMRGEE